MTVPPNEPAPPPVYQGGVQTTSGPAILFIATIVALVVAAISYYLGLPLFLALLALVVATVLGICTLVSSARQGATGKKPGPIAYTDTGEPIYPIVGYTAQGQPVTADRVSGPLPSGFNPRTNSLAIVALILGFVAGPLAIPFGHAARSQIRRTGEQGAGMALVGLILGYLSLCAVIVFVVALSGAVSG